MILKIFFGLLVLIGIIILSYYSYYSCSSESYIGVSNVNLKNRKICPICGMKPCSCNKGGCSSCSRGMIGPY